MVSQINITYIVCSYSFRFLFYLTDNYKTIYFYFNLLRRISTFMANRTVYVLTLNLSFNYFNQMVYICNLLMNCNYIANFITRALVATIWTLSGCGCFEKNMSTIKSCLFIYFRLSLEEGVFPPLVEDIYNDCCIRNKWHLINYFFFVLIIKWRPLKSIYVATILK